MSPEGAPTDQQVLVLEQRRVTASLAADVDELDKLIDDDCCYVHSSGSVDTKKSYLAQLRRGTLRYTRIACSEHAVSVHGSCGVATFRMDAIADVAGQPRLLRTRCTAVWTLDGDDQLIAFQSTALPAGQ